MHVIYCAFVCHIYVDCVCTNAVDQSGTSVSAENARLTHSLRVAERKIAMLQNSNSNPLSVLKNDSDTLFYTGIETKKCLSRIAWFYRKIC